MDEVEPEVVVCATDARPEDVYAIERVEREAIETAGETGTFRSDPVGA